MRTAERPDRQLACGSAERVVVDAVVTVPSPLSLKKTPGCAPLGWRRAGHLLAAAWPPHPGAGDGITGVPGGTLGCPSQVAGRLRASSTASAAPDVYNCDSRVRAVLIRCSPRSIASQIAQRRPRRFRRLNAIDTAGGRGVVEDEHTRGFSGSSAASRGGETSRRWLRSRVLRAAARERRCGLVRTTMAEALRSRLAGVPSGEGLPWYGRPLIKSGDPRSRGSTAEGIRCRRPENCPLVLTSEDDDTRPRIHEFWSAEEPELDTRLLASACMVV
jgi:hypothetical protein